jgi:hypothetical protein
MVTIYNVKVELAYQSTRRITVKAVSETGAENVVRNYIKENPDCLWVHVEPIEDQIS